MRERACCFTGHRAIENSMRPVLALRLLDAVEQLYGDGVTEFFAGGARGFDTMAAEAVLKFRETHPVHLHLILPCRDQCRGWTAAEKRAYDAVKKAADSVTVLEEQYSAGCMLRRNDALVAAAGHCICYFVHARGGTAYTVRRAKREGLPVLNLAFDVQEKIF